MSHWQLYYHFIWGTRHRAPIIDDERAEAIERSIRATCHGRDVLVHAIGIMPEHVHLVASIPPRYALAAVVQDIKGNSSHLLKHFARRDGDDRFAWQPEYGVLSFGERSLPAVTNDAKNQRAHHADDKLWTTFELVDRRLAVPAS